MRERPGREIETTRPRGEHVTPGQEQGVGSESDHEEKARVGSAETADRRARRVRPSVVRGETRGRMKEERRRRILRAEDGIRRRILAWVAVQRGVAVRLRGSLEDVYQR